MQAGIARPWGFHWDLGTVRTALREVVRRIVEVADPDEIVLFGSAVRGRIRRHSDFDLVVIKSGLDDRYRLTQLLHAHFFGIPVRVDLIVVTPEEAHEARGNGWTFLGRALRGGRCIYRPRANRRRALPR
jgi:predicted nucleotidyltransferase